MLAGFNMLLKMGLCGWRLKSFKWKKKIYVIISDSSDFSCSEMVHYQRSQSGNRNIASQRGRRVSLCSPYPSLPSQPRVSLGNSSGNYSWGFAFTSSITVLWMPQPTFTEIPISLPPCWLWVLSQTLNNGTGMEDSFSSKMQRRKAGWMCSLSLGLTPAPWLIPTLGRRAKAKVWMGLGGGGSFLWQPPLFMAVPLSAKTVFPGTSPGVAKEEQLDHLISFFPEQGPSHLCLLPCEWRRRPKNGAPAGAAPETETARVSLGFAKCINSLTSRRHLLMLSPSLLRGKTTSGGPTAALPTDKGNSPCSPWTTCLGFFFSVVVKRKKTHIAHNLPS